jgi:hypothetical protein
MSEIDKTRAPSLRSFGGMDQRLSVITLGVEATPDAWGNFTIGLAVGGAATRPPVEKPFGYSGVFAAWITGVEGAADGSVAIPERS